MVRLYLAFSFALIFGLFAALSSCGYPQHIDPPVYSNFQSNAAAYAYAQSEALLKSGNVFEALPTGSMEPLIYGGDYLVTIPVAFDQVKLGQIIVYVPQNSPPNAIPRVHRTVAQDAYGWLLSGDNAPKTEAQVRVTHENYIGVVTGIYRVSKRTNL